MSAGADRRMAVLEVVARAGAFMIEDDWARDFSLEGDPPPPLAQSDPHGHVVYVRSLSKCAAPGMRIGATCARHWFPAEASGPHLRRPG
ncbi:hypothetical protein [Acidisoma sp.]|uniref:hypothetical protein n=1 Tax=Acidisoma sp. TaxID=1872115 RepID=UPI003B00FA32